MKMKILDKNLCRMADLRIVLFQARQPAYETTSQSQIRRQVAIVRLTAVKAFSIYSTQS